MNGVASEGLQTLGSLALPNLAVYSAPSSNPAQPVGADTFTPPVGSAAVAAGVPAIATTNLTANPGDTLTLTGKAFTDDVASNFADTQVIVYGQTIPGNGVLSYSQLQDTSTNGLLATVSTSEPAGSMYLVWPVNNSGIGSPVAVNRTDAQWLSSATPALSTTVSVYGRNMDNSAGKSWIYIQPSTGTGQWVTVTNANPYRVQFTLPANLTIGNIYQVWVYNGLGGVYGWSSPLSLTVAATLTWTTTVNVLTYGATGNGVTNDGPAIQNAVNALTANQTLYFPAGTYVVNADQIVLHSNIRIQGAGQTSSTILFEGAVPSLGYGNFDIGSYDFNDASNIDFESIGLTYGGPTDEQGGPSLVRERNTTAMTFNNVVLTANSLMAIDWEGASNLQLTNSKVISNGVFVNGSQSIVLDNDLLLQAYDIYAQAGVTFVDDQAISVTNCTTENYYDYELSTDPSEAYNPNAFGEGRFMEFRQMNSNVYVASNQSIDLGEDATPADNNSGEQINVEGTVDQIDAPVVSATSNTFTFAGEDTSGVVGLDAIVTSGPGLGQQFVVNSAVFNASSYTTTFTLNNSFAVVPTAGSDIDVASAPTNMVFYQNTLNHSTGTYAGEDAASTGFEFFEGGFGIVIDGNTVNNTRYGVRLWSAGVDFPISSVEVINNTLNGVQSGIDLLPDVTADPNFYVVTVEENHISGQAVSYQALGAGLSLYNGQSAGCTLSVLQQNTVTGFPIGLQAADDPYALACENTFSLGNATYNNSSAISYASNPSNLILQGNNYGGYQTKYSGSVPNTILPQWLSNTSQAMYNANADSLTLTGSATLTADPNSTLPPFISTDGSGDSLIISPSAGTQVNIAGLDLTHGAKVSLAATTATPLILLIEGTTGLSIDSTSTIDIANNFLEIADGDLSEVNSLVVSGRSNGSWTGTGITSSTVAADVQASNLFTAVGAILNSIDGTPTASALYSTFDSAPANSTDVLVRYTRLGDANLNGTVDASDYSLIDNGFLRQTTGWFNGDFNYSVAVNSSDYVLIDNSFNSQQSVVPSSAPHQTTATAQSSAPTLLSINTSDDDLISKKKPLSLIDQCEADV